VSEKKSIDCCRKEGKASETPLQYLKMKKSISNT